MDSELTPSLHFCPQGKPGQETRKQKKQSKRREIDTREKGKKRKRLGGYGPVDPIYPTSLFLSIHTT
jgi:hypothetical protein